MNPKTTWLLALSAAVLFAYILFVEQPARQASLTQHSRRLLPGLSPAAVTSISLRPAGRQELRLERRGGAWQLTSPIACPADSNRVTALLNGMALFDWQDRILPEELRSRPNALADFGLINPQITIEAREGARAWTLRIGTNSVMGGQVFAQAGGGEDIFLADGTLLRYTPIEAALWRDLTLADLDALAFDGVKVRTSGKSFELRRRPDGLWGARAGSLSARADSAKVETLLKNLRGAKIRSFVTDDAGADLSPYGLTASVSPSFFEISFLKASNVLFSLQVGDNPTNYPELAFVRRLGQGNVVLASNVALRQWHGAYTNLLDRHMISEPAEQIGAIECVGEDRFVLEQNAGAGWTVRTAEGSLPADPEMAAFLIDILTNAQTEVEQTVVAAFEDYGLAHPSLEYVLRPAGMPPGATNVLADIQFGTNQTGRAFERRTDEPSVNAIAPELYSRLPRASWQLSDRRIWSFLSSNVVAFTVEKRGVARKFLRDPNGEWTFAPGSSGSINSFSIEETLWRLGELKAVYWVGVGEDSADRFGVRAAAHKITLEVQKEDKTQTLSIEFGGRSAYANPYAAVIRNGRRWFFEFPAQLFEAVETDLGASGASRPNPQ